MPKDLSRFTMHLIGNAHIDLVYRWRLNETIERIGPDTFNGVLDLMASDKDFTFVQSQMALYEMMQEKKPLLFQRIKQAKEEGRWAVVGGWAEYDHMLTGGESVIRHYLLGTQYMRANDLDENIIVEWCADSFTGHAHTLPTIMYGCGVRYLLMIRATPKDMPVFWWEGPDGSRVFVCKPPRGYGIAITPDLVDILEPWEETTGLTDVLVLYGMGDHGGGPRQGDLDALAEIAAQPGAPKIVHDMPLPFMQEMAKKVERLQQQSGRSFVYKGELPDVSRGAYTSESRNKRSINELEHLLLTAERLATVSSLLQRKPVYPRVDFDKAWEAVLRHQFHDDSPGTSRRPVYLDNEREYAALRRDVQDLIDTAIAEVGARLDTRGEGQPLIVYNPVPWTRAAPVQATVRLRERPNRLELVDDAGRACPAQIVAQRKEGPWHMTDIAFVARDMPSLGHRLYRVRESGDTEGEPGLRVGKSTLENEYLRVEIDPVTGSVVSIHDKRRGKELLSGPSNALQLLEEDPQYASTWVMWPTGNVEEISAADSIRLAQQGPVMATLSASGYWRDSYFDRQVTLYSGLPVVFFRLKCHWYERDAALKVAFRFNQKDSTATYGLPFGAITRATDGQEGPAHGWADLSDDSGGAAILNRGIYGHDADGNTMRLTLLRGIGDLDPTGDEGEHELVYALYPHGAEWQVAEVVRQGLELNMPVVTRQEMKRSGILSPWGAPGLKDAIEPSLALLEVEPENVILTALKLEQGQWTKGALIIRLYETEGKACIAEIKLAAQVALVEEVSHIEEPQPERRVTWDENRISLNIRPHEIRTIRVELAVYGLGLNTEITGNSRGIENG